MAHWHAGRRIASIGVRGLSRAHAVRQPFGSARSRIFLPRWRHAAAAPLEDLKDATIENALVSAGAYLLLRGPGDLVQRVLQSIAARATKP